MSVRHVIHDGPECRLICEVKGGIVVLSLFFGDSHHGFTSYASVHLAPVDARDRLRLFRAVDGLELVALGRIAQPERRVTLDTIHRSIMDVTRRPSA